MERHFVRFTWSIFSLRREKYKHARGLLAVESNCWSAREKKEKNRLGNGKSEARGRKNRFERGEKAFKSFPKVSSFLFKNLSLSLGTIL